MKRSITVILTVIALLSLSCVAFAADDGAAIYKSKCAMCHGPDGGGKVGPAVKGTSLTEAQIADLLTKGASGGGRNSGSRIRASTYAGES